MAAAGIQNGDQITAISWYKLSGFEMSSGRTGTFSVSMKNSTNTSTDLPGVDENPWSVYPNPAQKQVSVKFFTDKAEEYTITIADLSGKTVQINNGTTLEDETIVSLNLDNLSSGVYFLTLKTADISKTDKLVIQ
jgi:hypothetical protein